MATRLGKLNARRTGKAEGCMVVLTALGLLVAFLGWWFGSGLNDHRLKPVGLRSN